MATRQQVLSLFGATPQQVMERQRQQQAEFLASQRDGFQQSGAAIGLGLARLFGGKSPEMQAAEQMQQAIAGVDPNDPAALRELAQTVSTFAPERALQIAAYAGELEKSQRPDTEYREVITGYTEQTIFNPNNPLEPIGTKQVPIKATAIIKNGEITGYVEKPAEDAPSTDTQQAPVPDYITNEEGVVVPNPAKTGAAPAPATTEATPATTLTPAATPTQEPFVPQQGRIITDPEEIARLERSLLDPNVQPVPSIAQPAIKGELEYADPEALQEASDALRDQITKLEKSKDKNKAAKIKVLKKRRAEIQKLRLSSRRQGVPADVQATGKVGNVFSGFRNVK